MTPFFRIERLPHYVFAQVQALKLEARQRGEDIVDLGMGNPDQPTPPHIVDKLIRSSEQWTKSSLFSFSWDYETPSCDLLLVSTEL